MKFSTSSVLHLVLFCAFGLASCIEAARHQVIEQEPLTTEVVDFMRRELERCYISQPSCAHLETLGACFEELEHAVGRREAVGAIGSVIKLQPESLIAHLTCGFQGLASQELEKDLSLFKRFTDKALQFVSLVPHDVRRSIGERCDQPYSHRILQIFMVQFSTYARRDLVDQTELMMQLLLDFSKEYGESLVPISTAKAEQQGFVDLLRLLESYSKQHIAASGCSIHVGMQLSEYLQQVAESKGVLPYIFSEQVGR